MVTFTTMQVTPSQVALSEFLTNIHPVPTDVLKTYVQSWKPYEAARRTIMTAAGDTERFIYFVYEGVQKSYYQSDSKTWVMTFAYAPSFSGVLESFFTQTPSRYYLETVTGSHFLRMPFYQHEQFIREYRPLETLYRKACEMFLNGVIQRQHELMAFDMETRFRVFVQRSAHLFQLVPHKDVASYLRIDATNFSKLYNRMKI